MNLQTAELISYPMCGYPSMIDDKCGPSCCPMVLITRNHLGLFFGPSLPAGNPGRSVLTSAWPQGCEGSEGQIGAEMRSQPVGGWKMLFLVQGMMN